jgi:glycosyltransferase involved in cell wall biosynthesis
MGFFYNGGGERTVLNQAIELGRRGHDVEVFAPIVKDDCFPELRKEVNLTETSGLLPPSMPLRNAMGMIYSSILVPIKRLNGFDAIVAHGQPSAWMAVNVKRRYGTPVITYLHQVNRFFSPRDVDKKSGWTTDSNLLTLEALHRGNLIVKRLDAHSVKNSNTVLTNSEWIKKKITHYYGVNSHVCYPGLDSAKFKKTNERTKTVYLLSTNRHYPQKRLDYLLRCMAELVKSYPSLMCYITGGFTKHTRYLMKIAERYKLAGNVAFTGNIATRELIKLYQNACIYTFTSPEEDFGLGPIEAAACGVPSVVWDNAGPRETVIHGGTGFRATPYSVKELASYHRKLLEDPALRDEIWDSAFKYSRKKFTWEKHVDILEDFLLKVC